METVNIKQGSPEWHKLRNEHLTASQAAAMMGVSPYQKRDELLSDKKFGAEEEVVDDFVQKLYDKGHATEAANRPIIEKLIGDELYPATGIDGRLLASFDGITMMEDVCYEHKLWNEKLAAEIKNGELVEYEWHYWQLEHQLLVSGANKLIFVCSDGTEDNMEYMWYKSDEKRRKALISGWKRFDKDLETFEAIVVPDKPEAAPVKDLPAITYKLNGLALTSNVAAYKSAAEFLVEQSKEKLETDQDFADRESLIKSFKSAEEKLKLIKEQVLGEVHDIDEFSKEVGYIGELLRQARLNSEKQVKARKDEIKQGIIDAAFDKFTAYRNELAKEIGVDMLPNIAFDAYAACKGKRTTPSLISACNDEVARASSDVDNIVELAKANIALFEHKCRNQYDFLFNDRNQLIFNDTDYVDLLIDNRIRDYETQKQLEEQQKQETQATVVDDTPVSEPDPIASTPEIQPTLVAEIGIEQGIQNAAVGSLVANGIHQTLAEQVIQLIAEGKVLNVVLVGEKH